MAIRFHCASCRQPIEIDDEWAGRLVSCPYCQKTVTAPAESTIAFGSGIPTASPLREPVEEQVAREWSAERRMTGRNGLAIAAFALACVTVFFFIAATMVFAPHAEEIEWINERVVELQEEGKGYIAAMQEASNEFYEAFDGRPPGWMVAGMLLQICGGLTWLATLVCGLFALRHPDRRGLSLSALVVGGLVPVVFCCGGLL